MNSMPLHSGEYCTGVDFKGRFQLAYPGRTQNARNIPHNCGEAVGKRSLGVLGNGLG
jgi:hypothetical protein